MVVQKTWSETSELCPSIDDESTESPWSFQAPLKTSNVRAVTTSNSVNKQASDRQVAINTLAAMHRRYSLPGPVQPHSRPISEFRASANKSLDLLRQTIQSAVSKEIDLVIKKYLEKFFVPAVNNIRHNLGEESVGEDQVRAVCRSMLDATRLLYTTPKPAHAPCEPANFESIASTFKLSKENNILSSLLKRKEPEDVDSNNVAKAKRMKADEILEAITETFKKNDKWNPLRLNKDTLFIMGSHAHKVLGLGSSRGRLYARHSGLLRYPADSADKEWIANHNLVNAIGGKTYIMVLEDIEELAKSDTYKHNSLPMLGELSGFKVPPFMLQKIKTYVTKKALNNNILFPGSPQETISINLDDNEKQDITNDKITIDNEVPNIDLIKDVEDFDDIKVDGIKIEELDDIKVESIKIDDLDKLAEDIKVEDLNIPIDNIKVEDLKNDSIKLEHDDLTLCKGADDSSELEDLLDADIEFLSRNLGDIENESDARKTIEKLASNTDTISLDEFDFGTALSTNFPECATKCITVASTSTGMIHAVPVTQLPPPRVHYFSRPSRTVHHLPSTLTLHKPSSTTSHIIHGIPITTKSGTISTVMSQGTANIISFTPAPVTTSTPTVIGTTQYVNVNPKTFPTGNILHSAIVSRNIVTRNVTPGASTVTYSFTTTRPINQTKPAQDYDVISTTKDMIDNACNSSIMLKKVLTLGSANAAKSFMLNSTQKVLSTGYATGSGPPNVTIVSSGTAGAGVLPSCTVSSPPASSLSASHATLSALLSGNADLPFGKNLN